MVRVIRLLTRYFVNIHGNRKLVLILRLILLTQFLIIIFPNQLEYSMRIFSISKFLPSFFKKMYMSLSPQTDFLN